MTPLIQPQETTITGQDGVQRTYTIHKFPAIQGREIVTQYPISALPKLGDYKTNEGLMLKIMAHVSVNVEGSDRSIVLSQRDLVNNHVPDWETLAKLEWAMMEYNCSFFGQGGSLSFSDLIAQKLPAFLTKILTPLLAQFSAKGAPAS